MRDKGHEVVLHDTRGNLVDLLAGFRVLTDSLMDEVPRQGDTPYLLAREAVYERTIQDSMKHLEHIIEYIDKELEGGEKRGADAMVRGDLGKVFGDSEAEGLHKAFVQVFMDRDSKEYRALKGLLLEGRNPEDQEAPLSAVDQGIQNRIDGHIAEEGRKGGSDHGSCY